MRSRPRNKGPNPLTRSYESNGPDVKIRGTAQHVADKYAQLARDAQASGDPVAAENYLQHAEHYYRIIATAQEQFRDQFGSNYQRPFDEDGDEDTGGLNGHAYSPGAQGDDGDPTMQPQPYDGRGDGGERAERPQRYDRFERTPQERAGQERAGQERVQDRGGQDRGGQERFGNRQDRGPDRGGQDRSGPDRSGGQDRGERQSRDRFPRNDRQDFQRPEAPRSEGPRSDGPRQDSNRDNRRERRPEANDEQPGGLPAFLTTPVRPPVSIDEGGQDTGAPSPEFAGDEAGGDPNGRYGVRPRRRRRSRYGTAQGEDGAAETGADFAPEGAEPPVE